MQQIISLQLSGYSHRTADRPHRNKIKTSSVAPCLLAGEWGAPSLFQQDLGQWWDWDGVQQPAAIRGAWRLAGMSSHSASNLNADCSSLHLAMLWAPLGRTSGTFPFCSQLAWFQPLQETTEPSRSQSSRNPLNNFQIIIQIISFMKFKPNTCTSIETRMLWWKPTGCEQSWKDFDAHHPTGWRKGLNIRHLPYFTRKKAGWEGWVFLPPSPMFIHMPFKKFVHWINWVTL